MAGLAGRATATWEGLTWPAGVRHEGQLDVRLERTGPTRRVLDVTLTSRGESALGPWRVAADLDAAGQRWTELHGSIRARELRLTAEQGEQNLDGLAADFDLAAPELRLTNLHLTRPDGARLDGAAELNWQQRTWGGRLDAANLPLPTLDVALTAAQLEVSGDAEQLRIHDSRVQAAGIAAQAQGAYVFDDPQPLKLAVALTQVPVQLGEGERALVRAQNMAGELTVRGTVAPVRLEAEGDLLAEALQVRGETLGDVRLQVHGRADGQTAALRAEAVEWLGGRWQVQARYDRRGDALSLDVDAADIDLRLADQLLAPSLGVEVGRADLTLRATDVRQDLAGARVTGSFEARDVQRTPATVERISGQLALADGRLRITDLRATHGEGSLTGALALAVDQPQQLEVDLELAQWPLSLAGERLAAQVSGSAAATVDLAQRTGEGEGTLRLHLAGEATDLGTLTTGWTLAGSQVAVQVRQGQVLGGSVGGEAMIDLRAPLHQSTADVRWQNVSLAMLEPMFAPAADMAGQFAGTLKVERMSGRRAIGPVRATVTLDETGTTYRDLTLGEGRIVVFIDGPRIVLHRFDLDAVGGHLSLWGRLSEHEGARYLYGNASVHNLDLAELTAVLRPDKPPILGRIDGAFTLSTPLASWDAAFGRGSMRLRESDLANIPLFSAIYDLINIRLTGREPDGEGEAHFRIEDGVVLFDRFRYRNRGGEVRIFGRVHDVWQGFDSPISGYAIASVRPLPDIEGLNVLNEALATLQSELTPQRISGTINAPLLTPAPFRGLTDAIRSIVGGGAAGAAERQDAE